MNTQDEQSSILIHSHTFILRENILQEHIQDVPHSFVSFLLVFRRLTSINVATPFPRYHHHPPPPSSVCHLVDWIYNCIRLHDSVSAQIISLCLHAVDIGSAWRGSPPFIIIIIYTHTHSHVYTQAPTPSSSALHTHIYHHHKQLRC